MDSDSGMPELPPPSNMATRALTQPPTYMGNGSGGCSQARSMAGYEPVAAGSYPLFLYFVGTRFLESDMSARYDSPAPLEVAEAMARRGFVALSVDYDNGISVSLDKLSCTFDPGKAMSAVSMACALQNVDCDKGIATWGHSQGAGMAHAASVYESRVRAVWTTGYGGGDFPLPDSRLRVVNAEGDTMNGNWAALNNASGMSPSDCPDDGRTACLRSDGSGWILVTRAECASNSADHCWFDQGACGANTVTLEPNWIDPNSTKAFAIEANADWIAQTVQRP